MIIFVNIRICKCFIFMVYENWVFKIFFVGIFLRYFFFLMKYIMDMVVRMIINIFMVIVMILIINVFVCFEVISGLLILFVDN